MECSRFCSDDDIQAMREFMHQLSIISIVDFEEHMRLSSVRATISIWRQNNQVVGFAYVDDYNNLWFETEPHSSVSDLLEHEIVEWGVHCLQARNAAQGTAYTLDSLCNADNRYRLGMLEKYGFALQPVHTLQFLHSLREGVDEYPLPAGFSIRHIRGVCEVDRLVALHRAVFQSTQMNVAARLAMMEGPGYLPELDLVAVAPNGELAGFCVCGFDDSARKHGYTDPIGIRPGDRKRGIAKALVSQGLRGLRVMGAKDVRLGTSSDNEGMQKVAQAIGFKLVSEKLWYSKAMG